MLELGLIGVIGLALLYCTVLWWVNRHRDVLYGDFVNPSEGTATVAMIDTTQRPPSRPAGIGPALTAQWTGAVAARPAPAVQLPPPAGSHPQSNESARPSAPLDPGPARPSDTVSAAITHQDVLASLLETIKRDLSGAVSKS